MSASPSLATLKQQLAEVLAAGRPEAPGLGTGVSALDEALEGRGIPRGRLTEVVGAAGSGKTTLLRRLVAEAVEKRLWVAYVDAARTLAPRDWAHLGGRGGRDALGSAFGGVWMVRPLDPARGAWCADVLLRSGAFALVVLDGAPPLARAVAVRLTRLARDTGSALVVVGDERGASALPGALRLRVSAPGPRPSALGRARTAYGIRPVVAGGGSGAPGRAAETHCRPPYAVRAAPSPGARRFTVAVEKGGSHRTVEVSCAIDVARRLCAHPEVPDRRGVPDRGARGGRPAEGGERSERVLPRKRRAAEPDFGRPGRAERLHSRPAPEPGDRGGESTCWGRVGEPAPRLGERLGAGGA